ncbi:MAG: helix-turn-helix domain-containing protein [Lachnospiraceae bacterium]|nr:helix-turn-helix domain-containing protein [Lachnospiraceae bacterium]
MSDSILLLSADGLPYDFYDPSIMPNREHMAEPFELLQISVQPQIGSVSELHGELQQDQPVVILQAGVRNVYYTAYPGSLFMHQIRKAAAPLLHSHDYYELLFVLEGEIYQNIDSFRHFYSAGSACFVSPYTLHSEEYTAGTDARLLFLKLNRDYVNELLQMPRYFTCEQNQALKRYAYYFSSGASFMDFIPRRNVNVRERIHPLFEQLFRLFSAPDSSSTLQASTLICRLLSELFDPALFGNTPVAPGTRTEQQRFHQIRRYMEKQPGRITRARLEQEFHYSGDYLYKLVRRYTGLSIQDFALQISMKKAAQLLESTDLRINEIAERVGFRNFTQFYRAFHDAYAMTPRAYRTRKLSEHGGMGYNEG